MEKLYKYFSIIIDITVFVMQTWAYLKPNEYRDFKERAENLNMTEGELTQMLIRMFLNIPEGSYKPSNCINCQYYRISTSNAIQALIKVNEALSLVTPDYLRPIKKQG